ncbi:MAG: BrnA antitoxin family protein [Synergistaceae bacterium]|nr:BrnA antitoxin family protein [Synergistaceae bacterium]
MLQSQQAKNNFEKLDEVIDDDDDYEMSDEELANAEWFIEGGDRETILLSFDKSVLEFFRQKGNGYREYMNAALKDYVIAQRKLEAEAAAR